MATSFQQGFRRALKYYLITLMITLGWHAWAGWKYTFLPPPGISPVIISVVIGLLWAALNLTDFAGRACKFKTAGELAAHGIAFALVILSVRVFDAL
jgi:hypothetical protein